MDGFVRIADNIHVLEYMAWAAGRIGQPFIPIVGELCHRTYFIDLA